jgi:hypothetical protein
MQLLQQDITLEELLILLHNVIMGIYTNRLKSEICFTLVLQLLQSTCTCTFFEMTGEIHTCGFAPDPNVSSSCISAPK